MADAAAEAIDTLSDVRKAPSAVTSAGLASLPFVRIRTAARVVLLIRARRQTVRPRWQTMTLGLSACWRWSARHLHDARNFGVTRRASKLRLWPYGRKQLKQSATIAQNIRRTLRSHVERSRQRQGGL